MLRRRAHSAVSRTHMPAVLALKLYVGRNYELLPQVSTEKQFGIVHLEARHQVI